MTRQVLRPLEFLALYQGVVIKSCANTPLFPSVVMAQAICESGWGNHVKGRNMFGIKATGPLSPYWDGSYIRCLTHEIENGLLVPVYKNFRDYKNVLDSLYDHNYLILSLPRYKPVLAAQTAIDQCLALQSCGYSPKKSYAQSLIQIIKQYNLFRLDANR